MIFGLHHSWIQSQVRHLAAVTRLQAWSVKARQLPHPQTGGWCFPCTVPMWELTSWPIRKLHVGPPVKTLTQVACFKTVTQTIPWMSEQDRTNVMYLSRGVYASLTSSVTCQWPLTDFQMTANIDRICPWTGLAQAFPCFGQSHRLSSIDN